MKAKLTILTDVSAKPLKDFENSYDVNGAICFREMNLASLGVQSEQRKIGSRGQLNTTVLVWARVTAN